MPIAIYKNFDAFADGIAGVEGRFVPTAPSEDEWWLNGRQVNQVSLQQLQIGGCSTFAGGGQPNMLTLGLPMTDARRMRIDGDEMREDAFILMNQRQRFNFAGFGVTRWAGFALPLDHPNLIGALESLRSIASVRAQTKLLPLNHLRWLVNRLLSLDAAVRFTNPAGVVEAEQEISLAVARVLQFSDHEWELRNMRWRLPRARAIARCLEVIEASHGKPLLIRDLCAAAGMSERTLRTVFLETFGVPPMRFLKMKQLADIRVALLNAAPGEVTVTEVVEPAGVWDLSLFTRNYKALFSELPSVTLRSATDTPRAKPSLNWLVHAAQTFGAQAIAGDRTRRAGAWRSAQRSRFLSKRPR